MLDFNLASKMKPDKSAHVVMKPADPFNLKTLAADLEQYKPKVEDLKNRALAHAVTDDQSNTVAIDMGMQVKRLNKSLVAEGNRIVGPYDAIVKGIRSIINPFKSVLSDAETSLKAKISRYGREQAELARRIAQKKAADEASQRRAAAEALRQAEIRRMEKERAEALERKKKLDAEAEAAGVAPVEVVIPEVVEPEPVDIQVEVEVEVEAAGPIRTEEGTASSVKRWKYRVVNIKAVPEPYILMHENKPAIMEAIKAGVREIDGLEIYEDVEVRFRTA